jgi:ubiquinone/menaquinone biosynthesis C-methylase UbiE
MTLSEAEIQILATLRKVELEGLTADRGSLEEQGGRYRMFLEDWSGAYGMLAEKGLIEGDDEAYRLTDSGRPRAGAYHRERPDHYWYYYQRFYTAAHASAAHSRHCERVYGEDLCQEGQMDMTELWGMLDGLDLRPGDAVLDLGCGAGVISEYISDQTGAIVTGIDYAKSAIEAAAARTEDKRPRLMFRQGDLSALDLPAESFDVAIMIDSIYWVADTEESLSTILRSLRPGGQLAIVIVEDLKEGENRASLEAGETDVARALSKLGLEYELHDLTGSFKSFWPRIKQSVVALRQEFEAEGNGFICDSLEREADEQYLPALRADAVRRYLYHVPVAPRPE